MHDPVVALICGLPHLFFFHFRFVFTPIFHSSNCTHNIECKMSRGGLRTRLIWKLITTIYKWRWSLASVARVVNHLCLGDVLPNFWKPVSATHNAWIFWTLVSSLMVIGPCPGFPLTLICHPFLASFLLEMKRRNRMGRTSSHDHNN